MEVAAKYSLKREDGSKELEADAKIKINEESISVKPQSNVPILCSYRDIAEISFKNYHVTITLTTGDNLELSEFGFKYEDFLRQVNKYRNLIMLKDLLMKEILIKAPVEAEYSFFDTTGKIMSEGICEASLYDTAVVFMPEKGELRRIPYSEIKTISLSDYVFTMETEYDGKIIVTKMGRDTDQFYNTINKTIAELALKTQEILKKYVPLLSPMILRDVSLIMKDGRAVKKSELDKISPEIWKGLEKKIETTKIAEEFNMLKGMAEQDKMCIGIKKELTGTLGSEESEYIWFLIPVYGINGNNGGNAIIMESLTGGEGKATYFFRILSRADFPNIKKGSEMDEVTEEILEIINRSMLAINFRREPVYVPDFKLEEPKYAKYKFSIEKIYGLKILRKLFIGRVIHSTDEQWKEDTQNLLKFNVQTKDNISRWIKSDFEGTESDPNEI